MSIPAGSPSDLARSRPRGLAPRDEVWEGELHMVPPPHGDHGRLNDHLALFFLPHWEQLGLGVTYSEAGVRRPGSGQIGVLGESVPADYRTPDRSFLCSERQDRFQGGWIVGGPDVVLEIVSPGDETRARLPFYRDVGVREVILIDRDTRRVEVLRPSDGHPNDGGWEPTPAAADRSLGSAVLGTRFRVEAPARPGRPPALRVWREDDPRRELLIP